MCSALAIFLSLASPTQNGQFEVVYSDSLTDANELGRAIEPATRMIAKVVFFAQLTAAKQARKRRYALEDENLERMIHQIRVQYLKDAIANAEAQLEWEIFQRKREIDRLKQELRGLEEKQKGRP